MIGAAENWREDRQDERIGRLESDLREAQEKIRELQRRPMEWLLKTEMAIIWILAATVWIFTLAEIASKH